MLNFVTSSNNMAKSSQRVFSPTHPQPLGDSPSISGWENRSRQGRKKKERNIKYKKIPSPTKVFSLGKMGDNKKKTTKKK
jgi:hypothetical protein